MAVAGTLFVLLLAGCGGGKLTAQQAARYFSSHAAKGVRVSCHPASNGWDYACRVKDPGIPAITTEIDVNAHEITDSSG